MSNHMEDMITDFVETMATSGDEETQMHFVTMAMNLMSNCLGVFVAHRITECNCDNCRKGADNFLQVMHNSLENAVISTINQNLEANGVEALYEEKDPAADKTVNRKTYESIMKELKDDK